MLGIGLGVALGPAPAGAYPRTFSGVLRLEIVGLPVAVFPTAAGVVDFSGLAALPRIAVPAGAFGGQTIVSVPTETLFPIVELSIAPENQTGILERVGVGAPLGGSLPLSGYAKVCLYAA
jgi:hypothetical protein